MANRSNQGDDNRKFTVYIAGLKDGILQSHIEQIFKNCDIINVRMPRDKETNAFMGYAFVEFSNARSMHSAIQLSGREVNGQPIYISEADKNRRGDRGNRGRGSGAGGYNNNGPRFNNNRNEWNGAGQQRGFNGHQNPDGHRVGRGGSRGGPGRGSGGVGYQPRMAGPQHQTRPRGPPVSQQFEAPPPSIDDADRPRIKIQPRSAPIEPLSDRQLSERSAAIFGTGKPREASPIREQLAKLDVGSEDGEADQTQ